MKRVLIFIIAIVYLTTSSVAAITMHYCMGKMFAVNFSDNNKCDKCGMQHAKGCCESKIKILRAQDTHQFTEIQNYFEPSFATATKYYIFNTSFFSEAQALSVKNNSPPGKPHSCIYIMNCVFRI